jgi:hypothetical protein
MIYKFDKNSLSYKDVTLKYFYIAIGIMVILSTIIVLTTRRTINNVRYISEETKAIIIKESDRENQFTPDNLKRYILELNIRFPHIVYAQAVLESGYFKSKIFKINNNIFGMKEAKSRPTTNKGEQFNHAYYDNWHKSVDDYALFSAAYLNNIKTEDDYFEYLRQNYAEDTTYVAKIKEIILKINKLKN